MKGPYLPRYESCARAMSTARSKAKGKPLPARCRLFEGPDGTYEVRRYDEPMLRYHPDDTVTLMHHRVHGVGWKYAVRKISGIECSTIDGRRWVGRLVRYVKGAAGFLRRTVLEPGTLFRNGMRVELETGRPAAGETSIVSEEIRVVDKEKDRKWRRQVSEYRRLWRSAARLGAFDQLAHAADDWRQVNTWRRELTMSEITRIILDRDLSVPAAARVLAGGDAMRESLWAATHPVPPEAIAGAFEKVYRARATGLRLTTGITRRVQITDDGREVAV